MAYSWIRITKAGGTSLCNELNNKNINYYTPTFTSYNNFNNIYNHKLIISNIREPFSKIYSAYNFLKKESNNRCNKIMNPNISFYEFLKTIIELRNNCNKYNIELFNGIYCTSKKLIPGELDYQVYWVLSHVESNIDSINFFIDHTHVIKIKLENINEDIKKIFPDVKLQKLNQSSYNKINYIDLDEPTKTLFDRLYKHDIEFYNSLN